MTDISDGYDPGHDWDYDDFLQGLDGDPMDGRDEDGDWDYDDGRDGYEPDPTDHPDFWRHEHERYLRSLSPLGRLVQPAHALIWRYTWHWRMKARARWLLMTGRATTEPDEPPF